ncbi:MAG: UDP-N-acetylmuramoyl-tripeptide--D-alanyl-D-alanine ligase [Magnetovibrionaceae bacterium]
MSRALWMPEHAALVVEGFLHGNVEPIMGISIDSRTLQEGDLFVAIRGDSLDGHDYALQALEAGAAAALVDHVPPGLEGAPLIIVNDTTEALTRLGQAGRNRSSAKVIGVTGSVGKTGTKEALATVLAQAGLTQATQGNLNNHWGLPLSLARFSPAASFGVFEMGMNHAGEINHLTRLCRPHVAIITTVTDAHIEFFEGQEGIADAKAEIFNGVVPTGTAVLNRDNPFYGRLAAAAEAQVVVNQVSFGRHEEADVRLLDLENTAAGQRVTVSVKGQTATYDLGAVGEHYALNSLGVLGVLVALGLNWRNLLGAFADIQAPKGRGAQSVEPFGEGEITLIDESYNASPEAMRAAFQVLAADDSVRRVAVLGDMLELGDKSATRHRELAADLDALGIDQVYACGPMMKGMFDALPANRQAAWADDSQSLVPKVLDGLKPGDRVMVKGSAGSKMGAIVSALSATTTEAAAEGSKVPAAGAPPSHPE